MRRSVRALAPSDRGDSLFWAVWNGQDPVADRELQPLREEFADRVYFCSCDVDHEPRWPFIRECGVMNVPTLACFVDEEKVASDPRYRYPDKLREVLVLALTGMNDEL